MGCSSLQAVAYSSPTSTNGAVLSCPVLHPTQRNVRAQHSLGMSTISELDAKVLELEEKAVKLEEEAADLDRQGLHVAAKAKLQQAKRRAEDRAYLLSQRGK